MESCKNIELKQHITEGCNIISGATFKAVSNESAETIAAKQWQTVNPRVTNSKVGT